ncbi:general substrate transporter [Aaosphaeria arxii CBS 175.79]|uniref:General substrate transporter n=1 Tax=Aaosphaeria arxii CBS 175.79 TaxID=1450172 RepID=A0A6A5XLS5_9PLEO|nr:general substrate transporter [Aaosphaeria arxii CBS 175.79]KAF2013767.1 general substrate transporter [Aaosphaeria arxii CBS 175.79]
MAILGGIRGQSPSPASSTADMEKKPVMLQISTKDRFRPRILVMAVLVSMGGFIFGYDTGQISGFLEMPDFLRRFHDKVDPETGKLAFSNARSGTIVALLSIGTLIGAIVAAPIADKFGRKLSITFWNIVFCVGVIVQIATTTKWYQMALGRWVAGLGVGGLSVLTPMYQSETAPRYVRGALVSCYQLFITLGIFTAYCINFRTSKDDSARSWRLPIGIGFIWPVIMGVGMLFLRESPRWEYRKGKIESARTTIAISYGVSEDHPEVNREIREIKEKLDAERAGGGKHPWYEIFTGPRMLYRTLLGITLQALQQLTGANFYFYYGTTIFQSVGLPNPYVTSMILGAVNFGTTFPGLYIVEKYGRRPSLIFGALWMFMCFMVFSSLGHFALNRDDPAQTQGIGYAMIVFACLFIAGFAMTWGVGIWTVVAELYPSRYRAKCMGLATASNWAWNFLISFFTPYITSAIDYRYGYIFAACSFAGAVVVFLFVCESHGRTLEEIDTMYILGVNPMKSAKWQPPEGDDFPNLDNTYLAPGARSIKKKEEAGVPIAERKESTVAPNGHDNVVPEASGAIQ